MRLQTTLHCKYKVSWSDSSPQSGGEYYQGGASQLAGRLQALTYPDGEWTKLSSFVWSGVQAATTQHTWSGGSYHSLYWVKAGIATQTRGVTQPWCVSRQYLQVAVRKPYPFPPIPNVEYSGVTMRQFSIMPGQEVSELALLEPEMEEAATKEVVLLKPEITGYNVTFDFESTIGGRSQTDSEPALPGEMDHWIMLPQGTPKSVYLNGIGSHNLVYRVLGSGLSATGATVDAEGIVRAEQNHLNLVTLEGSNITLSGELQAGVALGSAGAPQWADRRMMRVAVLAEREITVKVHPVRLVDANGAVIGELFNTPDEAQLEAYLNSIFLVQANVLCDVTVYPPVDANYDVGLGVTGLESFGRGNGALDICDHTHPRFSMTAEERAIRNAAAANLTNGGDVHVFFVGVKDSQLRKGGMRVVTYHGEALDSFDVTPLGYAGNAPTNARGGHLWVWDYGRGSDVRVAYNPSHYNTIAHEIMHYVAQVGHCTDPDSPIYMPNADNENRLMTGRFGDKSLLGPKKLLKNEWWGMNVAVGFDETEWPQ